MEEPEIQTRDGVVVTRIAQVEEAQNLLVHHEEPEEAVVLPRTAMQCRGEIRRIAHGGEYVPGSGDQENNDGPANWAQALPHLAGEKLFCREQVDGSGGQGKNHGDETL